MQNEQHGNDEAQGHIAALIAALRARWRLQRLGAGAAFAIATWAAILVLAAAADNLLRFGDAMRWLIAALMWGAAIAMVWRGVIAPLRKRLPDDFFALLVEKRHPEWRNLVINAVQLGRAPGPGASERMVAAVVQDAARVSADLEQDTVIDPRPLRRAMIALFATLAAGGLYALAAPSYCANGLARLLNPVARIAALTATVIQPDSVRPGDARVPEGSSIAFGLKIGGRPTEAVRLWSKADNEPWSPLLMTPDSSVRSAFQCELAGLNRSLVYYFTAGDGRSRNYRIEVVPRPRVASLAITVKPPAYTREEPSVFTNAPGAIAALPGSDVMLDIAVTKPLQSGFLTIRAANQETMLDLAVEQTGRQARGAFLLGAEAVRIADGGNRRMIKAPAQYSIHLIDTDGFDNLVPPWHAIEALQDQPPVVSITSPGRDLELKLGDELPVTIEARDDWGVANLRLVYRVNAGAAVNIASNCALPPQPMRTVRSVPRFNFTPPAFKPGDAIQYWAVAEDGNDVSGPGRSESRRYSVVITDPGRAAAKMELQLGDFCETLEELIRLQKENRRQASTDALPAGLARRQAEIIALTRGLAKAMAKGPASMSTFSDPLFELAGGPMADALKCFEDARDDSDKARARTRVQSSLPIQDEIIKLLEALAQRLKRNVEARQSLKRIEKTDKAVQALLTNVLAQYIADLQRLTAEESELANKFEKMPKVALDETSGESADALKDLDESLKRWGKWAEGKVAELAKLPTGFVDDFGLRTDAKRLFEEIEAAEQRAKASKLEVALEDLGASLATKMKEDLEMWMPDAPDSVQWLQEEPNANKPMAIPEMPLPDQLLDLMGDLLQKEEEFDKEADDITSAWGDNLDQAGWAVSDGPISSFSAKGKTGNDLPNTQEATGRSGDGRRGKSAGQMVGDTARALEGRKTPARLGNERYEPGAIKPEAYDDPAGATGGGKKSGAGPRGLQGGTPPDFQRDMERLSAKQAGIREKAEQVARKLDAIHTPRTILDRSIQLMKSVEKDYRDLRYEDAARRRRQALSSLKDARAELIEGTGVQLHRAFELPEALREELLQATEEGYPAGYETMMRSYFRALSETAE